MKEKLATPVLIACVLFLGFITGTGIYQHLFWIPEMFASPTSLAERLSGEGTESGQLFWIPLHALTFITMLLSLIFNWKIERRRKLVLFSFIGYSYISLISIYFAWQLYVLANMTNPTEFQDSTRQWLILSWHRPILQAVIELLLLVAISRPALQTEETNYE